MEKEIVFVTSNKGKVASAQQYFNDIKLTTYSYDLIEPRSDDVKEIATSKVMQAYEMVKKPCIALDAGFFVESLNGFPRAFVNFALNTVGLDGILKLMEGVENRKCKFVECLAYYDGKEVIYFVCEDTGRLSNEIREKNSDEKWSELWRIYIPDDSKEGKTLSQHSLDEIKIRREYIASGIREFARWYSKK